jgi:hypothetical protein
MGAGAIAALCLRRRTAFLAIKTKPALILVEDDSGSRFEEIELPVTEPRPDPFGNVMHQSNAFSSPSVRFVELPRGLDQSWHHAPARQIVFVLSRVVEVGTSDNEKRLWGRRRGVHPRRP